MQPTEVYDNLMRDGVLVCDPSKVGEPSFLDRYGWMIKKLNDIDPKPTYVEFPIWAWYRFNSKEKKPDLRHSCYGPHGEKMVCLELEVPDEKVLLSDFDLWHFSLNDWWLYDCFYPGYGDEQCDKDHEWFDSLSKEEQMAEKEKSWERIFNIEPFENDWISRGKYVQAVFWELKKEYVRKVQFFTAR